MPLAGLHVGLLGRLPDSAQATYAAAVVDRTITLGDREACIYELDARAVRDVNHAKELLAELRTRVAKGRWEQPAAAHYVNVTLAGKLDSAVRTTILSGLGTDSGIDSVAVLDESLPRVDIKNHI